MSEEGDDRLAGGTRRTYSRSISWTDRSPSNLNTNTRPPVNSKARSCLPPLQPLSINRRSVEQWPRAGSDDLGVWPLPQTPRASVGAFEKSETERPQSEFQFKREKLAFFDKECSRIADHIYLGSDAVAKNLGILKQNGITHVLNCVGFVCPEYFKSDFVYKTLWLQDSPSEDITSILYDVFDYFEDVREQDGRVFVHCCQGVSRSTALVIAYLMWREGQSFEDAFQYVKAARGVTNPNMGFACQLLQCQKRVHAVPASPSSVLRMYRMAPHSPYDPLHLVPKMITQPCAQGLDSRGAFIVHVPSAIYVWIGNKCNSVMSSNARRAASQVVHYERAKGPIVSVKEGEEPLEFWDALSKEQLLADGCDAEQVPKERNFHLGSSEAVAASRIVVGKRKVDEYDTDFEIFCKAVIGGVVPPFSVSNTESETCLPARENGWGRLRRKFANGIMKDFVTSSKLNCNATPSNDESCVVLDSYIDEFQKPVSDPSSPSSHQCGSPDSFDCFPSNSSDRVKESLQPEQCSIPIADALISPPHARGSLDSFSCLMSCSPRFSSKSSTLSPSASDYSSSFTFSPSSSNWSDLSYVSPRQPSPSGIESTDLCFGKNVSSTEIPFLFHKETSPPLSDAYSANYTLGGVNVFLPCKGFSPSIAERRGSNPPPRMSLPSVDESCYIQKNLVRSWSFSLPGDDVVMQDVDFEQCEHESNREEFMFDANANRPGGTSQSSIGDNSDINLSSDDPIGKAVPALYQWPCLNKVENHHSSSLDSKSAYILVAPDGSRGRKNPSTIFVWVGREVLVGREPNKFICTGCSSDNNDSDWQNVGHNFLNKIGFPVDTPVQVVKDGEEPDLFRNHLRCLSLGRDAS